jgi:hypothetical protein
VPSVLIQAIHTRTIRSVDSSHFCELTLFVTLIGRQLLHCNPLQNATISKIKAITLKRYKKWLKELAL